MTEQDEIRRLKELIAKQQLQLAEKDEIIRKQNIRIENMTQALLHAKKKIFGRSSEMTAPMKGQMFNGGAGEKVVAGAACSHGSRT